MRAYLIALYLVILGGAPANSQQASSMDIIQRYHPGCTESADPRGGDCTAAAHRLCAADGPGRLGFVIGREVMGRNPMLAIACARHGWYGDVAYAELADAHPDCRRPAAGQSGACLAAARRYCTNERAMDAGIIQEVGPASAGVACFKATRTEDVGFDRLGSLASGCRGPGDSTSLACFKAAASWCRAFGTGDLGLPQETGPRSLAVACLPARRQYIAVASSAPLDDN